MTPYCTKLHCEEGVSLTQARVEKMHVDREVPGREAYVSCQRLGQFYWTVSRPLNNCKAGETAKTLHHTNSTGSSVVNATRYPDGPFSFGLQFAAVNCKTTAYGWLENRSNHFV